MLTGTDDLDLLYGLGGRDVIDGGTGNDLIDGGFGRDDLTGGEGEDWFVFADFDRGFDVIRDFVPGTDQIVLDHEGMDAYDDLRFIRFNYEDTPSTLIRFLGEDGSVDKSMGGVVLKGIAPGEVTEADFIFAEGLPVDLSEAAAEAGDLDGAELIAALFVGQENGDASMEASAASADDGMTHDREAEDISPA
jgi:Ca2+-binding RTX toxin-like protein